MAVTEAGNLLGSRSPPPEMGRISLATCITRVADAGMWVGGVFGGMGVSLTSGYVNVAITNSEPMMQLEGRQNQTVAGKPFSRILLKAQPEVS